MTAQFILIVATVLCSLVAGFLFAWATVVMPGIARLDDHDFLRAFREMDGVIQRGQPLFGLVWVGSILALVAAAGLLFGDVAGIDRALLTVAAVLYLLGVQLPTFGVNVPLNNKVQALDLGAMTDATRRSAREEFEVRWNRSNRLRTVVAVLVTLLLSVVLLRL